MCIFLHSLFLLSLGKTPSQYSLYVLLSGVTQTGHFSLRDQEQKVEYLIRAEFLGFWAQWFSVISELSWHSFMVVGSAPNGCHL